MTFRIRIARWGYRDPLFFFAMRNGESVRVGFPSLANQTSRDEPGKTILSLVPPSEMIVALSADCKSPCIIRKPARLSRRIAHIGGAGCVAVAEHVKRVTGWITKSMFVRLNCQRRTSYLVLAALAAHFLLRLHISGILNNLSNVNRSAIAHGRKL